MSAGTANPNGHDWRGTSPFFCSRCAKRVAYLLDDPVRDEDCPALHPTVPENYDLAQDLVLAENT